MAVCPQTAVLPQEACKSPFPSNMATHLNLSEHNLFFIMSLFVLTSAMYSNHAQSKNIGMTSSLHHLLIRVAEPLALPAFSRKKIEKAFGSRNVE